MKIKEYTKKKGFTLVETMIGVTIIGILTAISVPGYKQARSNSLATVLSNNLRSYAQAFEIECLDHGDWPADAQPGVIPAGMEGDLPRWTEPTEIGGNWDWEYNASGVTAGVSIRDSNAGLDLLMKIDRKLDDGNLSTGRVIASGNLLTMVLQD